MLNLHALRVFTALAEARSFSRAAEGLFISQPAVSKAIRELEEQLGLTLVDRSARPIALTAAGVVLLSHARRIFASERAAVQALADLRDLEAGSLTIGASSTVGIYLLPPLIAAFHRRYPGVRLTLDIGNTQQVVEHLHASPLDIAFVEGPVDDAEVVITPWREDELLVIAPPEHPLVGAEAVPLARLLEEPLVLREPGSGTREVIEIALRERDLAPRVVLEIGSTEAIKRAVAAGLGLAIVSAATVGAELRSGQLASVRAPELVLRRQLSWLSVVGRPQSPALAAFLELAA
ncbi:MAG TPA: LysR substrate-binding domain-containing protein [Chloroflexaceae bacterium]|nr:LysR substrate-binding domain-containing protein [Chloroflexaceae bacterium]